MPNLCGGLEFVSNTNLGHEHNAGLWKPMNLRQLEVFRAVMLAGTVTEAARLLRISQPAISRMLRHTEDQLRMRLFVRERGRLHPTPEARQLFIEVATLFSGLDRVSKVAEDLRDSRSGRILVGTIPTLGVTLLPPALTTFLGELPSVNVGLKVLPIQQVIDRVANQQLDLGITYAPATHPALDAIELFAAEIVCVLPRRHALAQRDDVSPVDLSEERLISVNRLSPFGLLIDNAFTAAGVTRNATVEVSHAFIAYALVQAGVGVAVVDAVLAFRQWFPDVVVKRFRPQLQINPRVVHPRDRPLSRLSTRFIDHLQSAAVRLTTDRGADWSGHGV